MLENFDSNGKFRVDPFWYFTVYGTVGRLTLILTKIEQHLESLFGEHFVNYRGRLDRAQNGVLDNLIGFYKGDTSLIKYEDFPKMGFNELYNQVEAALSSENK